MKDPAEITKSEQEWWEEQAEIAGVVIDPMGFHHRVGMHAGQTMKVGHPRDLLEYIDIVFDGAPGHHAPRFVEVEDGAGKSVSVGEWLLRKDGYYVLRISRPKEDPAIELGKKLIKWSSARQSYLNNSGKVHITSEEAALVCERIYEHCHFNAALRAILAGLEPKV